MGQRLERLGLTVLGGALIALMGAIVLQVVCSALDINPLLGFARAYAFVGDAVTLNTLLDLQWHLLVICGLLPAGLVWITDRHVRVDFIYARRREKTQARINLLGNLLFAAPFLALALPASWKFMRRAWSTGEGSSNGGMNDLWLIKAVLPLGLGLLAVAVAIETIRLVRQVK